jgi:hypothetical protein
MFRLIGAIIRPLPEHRSKFCTIGIQNFYRTGVYSLGVQLGYNYKFVFIHPFQEETEKQQIQPDTYRDLYNNMKQQTRIINTQS